MALAQVRHDGTIDPSLLAFPCLPATNPTHTPIDHDYGLDYVRDSGFIPQSRTQDPSLSLGQPAPLSFSDFTFSPNRTLSSNGYAQYPATSSSDMATTSASQALHSVMLHDELANPGPADPQEPAPGNPRPQPSGIISGRKPKRRQAARRARQPAGKRSARTTISPESKEILNAHFMQNQYPSPSEVVELAKQILLPPSAVKTWFSNTRARKTPEALDRYLSSSSDDEPASEDAIKANIEAALREEKLPSWVDMGRINDAVPPSALPSLTPLAHSISSYTEQPEKFKAISLRRRAASTGEFDSLYNPFASSIPRYTPFGGIDHTYPIVDPYVYPRSRAGSQGSGQSGGSSGGSSGCSVSSRESRKGRRRWATATETNEPKNSAPYFCTSPGCGKNFMNRYAWVRHEESVHWPQKSWVCCKITKLNMLADDDIVDEQEANGFESLFKEHFADCLAKPEAERTFFRKDHLLQHIRTCHIDQYETSTDLPPTISHVWEDEGLGTLVELWEGVVEYAENHPSRHCNVCPSTFASWSDRKHHFQKHFEDGVMVRKTPRWAERQQSVLVSLAEFLETTHENSVPVPTCPLCGQFFTDYAAAVQCHQHCRAWSCSFLGDFRSVLRQEGSMTRCTLCHAFIEPNEQSMNDHIASHRLDGCDQTVHHDFSSFCKHIKDHHGALDQMSLVNEDLKGWMYEMVNNKL